MVGAVVLKPIRGIAKELIELGIQDSKLLSPKRRKEISEASQKFILYKAIQFIPVDLINNKSMGYANKLGFQLAAQEILKNDRNVFFLTDAFKIPEVESNLQKNIIRGDSTSISIALASILAKLERDAYMKQLSAEFPDYGFERHKGYGTAMHRSMIKKYGVCPHHRTDFVKHYI